MISHQRGWLAFGPSVVYRCVETPEALDRRGPTYSSRPTWALTLLLSLRQLLNTAPYLTRWPFAETYNDSRPPALVPRYPSRTDEMAWIDIILRAACSGFSGAFA
jgi:hypothetical protein